uniref:Uncharacterized protein n=1 Tax=Cacopsylla melanoneura TaxID=428564 RepID=A0A8D9AZR5_9HEMI
MHFLFYAMVRKLSYLKKSRENVRIDFFRTLKLGALKFQVWPYSSKQLLILLNFHFPNTYFCRVVSSNQVKISLCLILYNRKNFIRFMLATMQKCKFGKWLRNCLEKPVLCKILGLFFYVDFFFFF